MGEQYAPVQILKELRTGETDGTEIKTSYRYVFELQERLDNTMKIAQKELLRAGKKTKCCMTEELKKKNFKKMTRCYCYCQLTKIGF